MFNLKFLNMYAYTEYMYMYIENRNDYTKTHQIYTYLYSNHVFLNGKCNLKMCVMYNV